MTDELPSNAESGGVQPDQVWADNDRRCAGRTLRVDSVDSVHAYCTVLTNPTETQRLLDRGTIGVRDTRGNKVRILLSRMRPTSTGYRLVTEDSPTGR
ncbi:UNVERIFIED_ORG: hypothetical protein FHR35_009126 [Microbispora rosea subsp. rosea]